MADLTTATGLTKGSIYGNFKDKDDVAVHAFQHNIDLIFDFFSKELKAAGSTLDKLLAYPRGFRKIYPMILSYGGCPILNTGVEADDTHAVLRKMAVDVLAKWKKSIVVLMKQGHRRGRHRSGNGCAIGRRNTDFPDGGRQRPGQSHRRGILHDQCHRYGGNDDRATCDSIRKAK